MSQLIKINLQTDCYRDINHDRLSRFLEEMMIMFIHMVIVSMMKCPDSCKQGQVSKSFAHLQTTWVFRAHVQRMLFKILTHEPHHRTNQERFH